MIDKNGEISRNISVEIITKGSNLFIQLTLDNNWLNNNKRTYPVTIDPTITIQPDSSSGKDTFVLHNDSYS